MSSEFAVSPGTASNADRIVSDCIKEACDRMASLGDYSDIKWMTWPIGVARIVGTIADSDDLAFGGRL